MPMQDDDLHEVCSLPRTFRAGNVSWRELVGRSPYSRNRSAFTEDRLASYLRGHPEQIDVWLAWSEDKRCSPSPFFRRSGSRYELGYVEREGRFRPSEFFAEPTLPCARFILEELAV
jgi:hypothetical protein